MVSKEKLGDEIKRARTELGLTQQRLAELTGVTVNYISLVENGHRGVGMEQMDKFANAFGIPTAFLLVLAEVQPKRDDLLESLQNTIRATIPILAS